MNKLEAYKMDGLGNDFVIFDNRKKSISLTKDQIIKISDRSNIGCDQVIFIDKDEKDNPFNETPALANANKGIIPKATYGDKICSIFNSNEKSFS